MEDIAATTFAHDLGTNAWKWATMYIKHHDKILVDELVVDIYIMNLFFFISAKN